MQVIGPAEAYRLKARLKTEPEYKDTVEKSLGAGASAAILQDRYAEWLVEIGCGQHVSEGLLNPLTHTVNLVPRKLPEAQLINLCTAGFPENKSKDEVWVQTSGYFLRYRGKECSVFKSEF